MYKNYTKIRFSEDKNREIVWKEIVKYIQKYIKKDYNILDLGSGYCNFINLVVANKKYALDKYINPKNYVSKGIIPLFGNFSLMNKKIDNDSLDVVFTSNFFEHLNENEFQKYIKAIKDKLKKEGILIIIQPNYRLCYKNYFDDYTHLTIWSDKSIKDYLKKEGFYIIKSKPKFLPFSLKSKLPKIRPLIWLYLRFPIKPLAKQMLIIAKNVEK